ncbi:Nuclease SbcCD subunit D [Vibrio stylophorae]|uniref:Nuclease SbcCD subunit D n=1 Tax=Vibrio stylophorae TaxID=659351 RepID=A0ABN8DY80_9VIBR|nr:exonuclease subunit SbcD [Vibrio stylophorae]CAH0535091.1 Nuclease SbcCD subunit D [Vibrio stylophorae]
MRILHTSDWHLGQHFVTKSRQAEHKAFLDWLLTQVDTHRVDAVIVAGDIFDTGAPPSYARELLNAFIVSLQNYQCQLVLLAGNHDSVATLNESKQLVACLNTHVIAAVSDDYESQMIALKNKQGELGLLLCAVPYIRSRDLLKSRSDESAQEKKQALQQAISDHYHALYDLAKMRQAEAASPVAIMATGHLMAAGSIASESVRDLYVGTLDALPASAFPAVDYVALGHIHRSQRVAQSDHIRYCGSPIALSFDEVRQQKEVLMVDFAQGALEKVTPLAVPCFQPMALIKGNVTDIEVALKPYQSDTDTATEGQRVWLDVEINSNAHLSDIQRHIQQLTADLPVEVLLLRRAKSERLQAIERQAKETLSELTPQDVFERRMGQQPDLDEARQQRLRHCFQEVLTQLNDMPEEQA